MNSYNLLDDAITALFFIIMFIIFFTDIPDAIAKAIVNFSKKEKEIK